MNQPLDEQALDLLFRTARTHHAWLNKPVPDDLLRKLYDVMKFGPTSVNSCPVRIVFLRSPEAKQRLMPALSASNVQKTVTAPVTAIIAYDLAFYEKLPKLFPHNPAMRIRFENSPAAAEITAFRNGTLQGGYFIVAARALGLDCGALSGFDNAKVDAEFFTPEGTAALGFAPGPLKSNFLCNLGYGDVAGVKPAHPRPDFDEVCRLL